MPPLNGCDELCRYKEILASWSFTGFIQWKPLPAEWLRDNLDGYTQKAIGELMYKHSDEVDQTAEGREGYRDLYSYHYDFRIPINGRTIYIETVFVYGSREDDSVIRVVNMKAA